MKNPVILFRKDRSNADEFEKLKETEWTVHQYRSRCAGALVFGRYSVLPDYQELQEDLNYIGSSLVNSYDQHVFISSFEYYHCISDLTFETWWNLERVPDRAFPVVVKGATNSKKHRWDTQMFAATRRDAALIAHELKDDVLIGHQRIIYRQYVPLRVLEEGINKQPFANEWRFFIYRGKIVDHGFYWSQIDAIPNEVNPDAIDLVGEVARRVGRRCEFYVVDVAERDRGGWVVVELNEGQCSGLSLIDPVRFYANLRTAFLASEIQPACGLHFLK